ncbi:MAG TPA: DNA-formamidopyrimidine glycosylase family protein [Acidimicrobiales bacterium]|nr:DNA-formamidopyrimidine glycosylase family protein [Acidimicrobiales bacterium]
MPPGPGADHLPELPEVEYYRRLAERALARPVCEVRAPDAWYLKGGVTASALAAALVGNRFTTARRTGKLLLLDTDGGATLGLRFGMTGRLLVTPPTHPRSRRVLHPIQGPKRAENEGEWGWVGVERLLYSSDREERAWDRFGVDFADGGALVMRDPRRLGGVSLDPDESRLGVDAASVTPAGLRRVLEASGAPLKARLMDQSRLAGVGNLIADEVLFRAGLDPARPAGGLSPAEIRRLHRHLRQTIDDLVAGGGSHTGRLMPARTAGGTCPRDGTPLRRTTVGRRTTWSCPRHQR